MGLTTSLTRSTISFDAISLTLDDQRFKKKAGKTARFSSRPTILIFLYHNSSHNASEIF
jgi:hypothetical protein